MAISRSFNRIKPEDEDPIRVAFLVREALSILYGDSEDCAKKLLLSAEKISKEKTVECIEALECNSDESSFFQAILKGNSYDTERMVKGFGEGCYIELPFRASWGGSHIHFGNDIYVNSNVTFVDDGHIYVGNR